MDSFGIGTAMRAMLTTYRHTARRSGRTTMLVESVKDGDRIVFASSREADRVARLIKERGVKVECIVVDPKTPGQMMERGSLPGDGRSVFDHTWLELFFEYEIERSIEVLDELQRATSGYGEAHRETARRFRNTY